MTPGINFCLKHWTGAPFSIPTQLVVCVNCATHSLGFVTHSSLPELFSNPKADGFTSPRTGCCNIPAALTCQGKRHEQLGLSAPSVHLSHSASAPPHLPPPHPLLWAGNSPWEPLSSDYSCLFPAWLSPTCAKSVLALKPAALTQERLVHTRNSAWKGMLLQHKVEPSGKKKKKL